MKTADQLFWRGIVLFIIGIMFTFVLGILRSQHHSNYHSKSWNYSFIQWWLPLLCGSGSALVGLIYPVLKSKNMDSIKSQEWSHVLRCVAIFVGINEACTKVEFPSNLHLSISLAVLSMGLWWYFDRTLLGFGIGVIVAVIATLLIEALAYHKVCIFVEREFSCLKSWLPAVAFSGAITVANIGEQLAINDNYEDGNKFHTE